MPGMSGKRTLVLGTLMVVAGALVVAAVIFLRDGPAASGIEWSNPEMLPAPRFDDYRSEFVSEEEGYRFHPRSGRVTPATAYRFDTGHCGLGFLTDFDGSFWRPVDPERGEPPDFFINQDLGAIALVDFNRAIYRSSAGVEVELERIRGPVVTQPCA